jgi:hypothetical protein
MKKDKNTVRRFFKVGDKVIVTHEGLRCYGKVIRIEPDNDIVVRFEDCNYISVEKRYDNKGYELLPSQLHKSFYSAFGHSTFPLVMHEDVFQELIRCYFNAMNEKEYEQD